MNIIEEAVGVYRVEFTGMSIRQIKDVLEDKWGAMVWSGGAAYPSGDIKLQFKKAQAAQPSQAGELSDAKRLDWIRDQLFEHRWNGVVGKGCAVQWTVAPDFRFKQRELTDDSGIAAGDFRRAIDVAINTKEAK